MPPIPQDKFQEELANTYRSDRERASERQGHIYIFMIEGKSEREDGAREAERKSQFNVQRPRTYREKFDSDAKWYPGKAADDAESGGRPKVITKTQENAIAQSAMSMKEKGLVPSVAAVLAACPRATLNPETDEPFTAKVILGVFRTRCYDTDPQHPWDFVHPKNKTCLHPDIKTARWEWAVKMLEYRHHAGWYFRNVVWMDPCYTIVPGRPKTIFDQQQHNFGKAERWMSEDSHSKASSVNLRTSPYTNKTTQWGDAKVWWFLVLAKGKVHVHVVGKDWLQGPPGQAQMIAALPKVLKKMLGAGPHPNVVFTDRGPGFYHPASGTICPEYYTALEEHGFQPWAGEHAKWQPPDIPDLLLHETCVAWVRKFLRQHPIKLGDNMAKNIQNLMAKLEEAVDHINTHYEVEDRFPQHPSPAPLPHHCQTIARPLYFRGGLLRRRVGFFGGGLLLWRVGYFWCGLLLCGGNLAAHTSV